jgi:aryl-alcohol dehydrogenase-like predicted oxidoreductase
MAFQQAPEPPTNLGRYRLLAPNASVRVSPICLGAMNFGTAWEGMLGKCDKQTAFDILDNYYGK